MEKKGHRPTFFDKIMLLSPTDRSRFKILYPELTHSQLADVFNTNILDIRTTAKILGIFDEKRRDKDVLPSAEKNDDV